MSAAGTTRIVRLHALGGPEVLRVDTVPIPVPGPGEVRFAVKAIGLNRIETTFRSGGFGAPALPAKIGYEAAGIVEALGQSVTGWREGDRVAVLPGIDMLAHGTYGERIVVPADMLVRVPDVQPFEEAAATWMQYVTAYALQETGIAPGDHVVITAASSSVGLAAIQIVNAAGGIPIAVSRTSEKAAALLANGAAHVVVANEGRLAETIRQLTGGSGAKLAFDAVAGETLASLMPAMAPGGTIILYGSLGGDRVAFDVPPVMLAGLTLRGFAAFQVTNDPARRAAALAYINAGLASGTLNPVIDRVFELDQIADAHRHLEGGTQLGKIVVRVDATVRL